jgi:hypothetical protein
MAKPGPLSDTHEARSVRLADAVIASSVGVPESSRKPAQPNTPLMDAASTGAIALTRTRVAVPESEIGADVNPGEQKTCGCR